MPSKIVDVPGVGQVEFPDTMSDDEIGGVIKKQHPELTPSESPMDYAKNTLKNLPGSALNTAKQMAFGPQLMAIQNIKDAYARRNAPTPSFKDAMSEAGNKAMDIGSSLVRPFIHPIDSFEQDPVGTAASWYGAKKLMPSEVGEATSGMGRAAMRQVRPTLDKASIWHPLKNVGIGYDALKNTVQGGIDAVRPPQNSPFNKFREVSPPSSGGTPMSPKPTGFGGSGSGLETPQGEAETRPVQSPTGASTQVPETPTNAPASFSSSYKPVSRKVIMDEQGKPVAYDDPQNPYNGPGTVKESEPEPDIHDQIAGEGVDKRAADSREKYEDVYQNVIKGNYTADELRNMGPEEKTALDLKIKNMKHPEDHPNAGKKKYGTGLNPLVVDSLARRLEAETQ